MIGSRWGVTDGETALRYPCDAFLPAPALQLWRGVTIQAEPETVWRWLIQIRIAPYSYDWIDNLGHRSPRRLLPLPEPRAGNAFTTAGCREIGRILSVECGRHLTGRILGAYMSYLLAPGEHETTRLLLKVVVEVPRLAAPALSVADLLMARRQLLNLKALAEEVPSQGER